MKFEEQKKTILIVDDEADLREILSYEFSREGYNVITAADGLEAFEIIKKPVFIDIILTDVQMPNWDGVKLLTEVKKINPDLPVVMFITGFTKVSPEIAYDLGAEALFDKPFDKNILSAAIKKALELRQYTGLERKHTRVESDLKITLDFKDGRASFVANVLNLGRGGALIGMHDNPPRLKQELGFNIAVTIPSPSVIKGSALVRWIRTQPEGDLPLGYGVEFLTFEKSSRKTFFEILNTLKTTAYIPRTV